jgi:hypothetical protein
MIVLGTNSIKDTGFDVTNSVRFEQSDDPYFQKSPTGDGNQRTFTFSVWLKMDLHASGDTHKIFDTGTGTNYFTFYVTEEPKLVVKGRISGSTVFELIPTQVFRDPTAWFHLYIAVDTTQGTASNRGKIYINGSQVTDFGTATYPSQNTDFEIQNASYPFRLGADKNLGDEHYDGYMAEYMFVDGAVQALSDFGEFDEDSPTIWKPKDISAIDVNPANSNGNGFYLDFKDSSNLGNDVGVNAGTDFSENNIAATDQATDTPTNNFCTFNPIANGGENLTFSEGNTTVFNGDNTWRSGFSTFAVNSGKWYFEAKRTGSSANAWVGIVDTSQVDGTGVYKFNNKSRGYGYSASGEKGNGSSESAWGDAYAQNDIVGIAVDFTNSKIYFSKNGTWQNSGNPESGSTGTGSMYDIASGYDYFFATALYSSSAGFAFNFGSPSFAISSGNADADGYGNFEYSVPSGYFSLNTKNLAEYGG